MLAERAFYCLCRRRHKVAMTAEPNWTFASRFLRRKAPAEWRLKCETATGASEFAARLRLFLFSLKYLPVLPVVRKNPQTSRSGAFAPNIILFQIMFLFFRQLFPHRQPVQRAHDVALLQHSFRVLAHRRIPRRIAQFFCLRIKKCFRLWCILEMQMA